MKFIFLLALFAVIISTTTILPATELTIAEKELTKAIHALDKNDGRSPCLCDPAFYARIIKAHPKAAEMPVKFKDETKNPLLLAAAVCPAAAVERMINAHIDNGAPVDQVTYKYLPDQWNKYRKGIWVPDANLLHVLASRSDWDSPEELAAFERVGN